MLAFALLLQESGVLIVSLDLFRVVDNQLFQMMVLQKIEVVTVDEPAHIRCVVDVMVDIDVGVFYALG